MLSQTLRFIFGEYIERSFCVYFSATCMLINSFVKKKIFVNIKMYIARTMCTDIRNLLLYTDVNMVCV